MRRAAAGSEPAAAWGGHAELLHQDQARAGQSGGGGGVDRALHPDVGAAQGGVRRDQGGVADGSAAGGAQHRARADFDVDAVEQLALVAARAGQGQQARTGEGDGHASPGERGGEVDVEVAGVTIAGHWIR